jgi:predicted solute-binding protein
MVNGRIDCEGLAFDVEFYDIEELNALAQQGIADISKISCALLPAITKSYALLDAGAALGRGNGPLLVRRKGDEGALHHVIVPGMHTTANALMQRLFPEVECRTPMLFSEVAAAVLDAVALVAALLAVVADPAAAVSLAAACCALFAASPALLDAVAAAATAVSFAPRMA